MLNYLKHVVYLCIYLFIYFCRIFCNCNTRNEVWIISMDAFINKPQRNHRWSIAFVNRRGSFSSIANLWNIYPESGFRIRHLRYLLIIECILSKNSTRKKKHFASQSSRKMNRFLRQMMQKVLICEASAIW